MGALWQDIRYGFRMLVRNPGLTVAALLTLALGIGANTAIFSVMDKVFIRPLPLADAERLLTIRETNPQRAQGAGVSGPVLQQLAGFTDLFEELTAYLAQVTDKTRVTELMGISWTTVGAIVERVVARRLDPARLEGLRRIGVDEFSYRKRHRYLTTVVDHDRRRVVWAAAGRSAATLGAFFDALGEERCAELECVTMDMAGGYIKAVEERLPEAQIVFDRFHVQRLASDALDAVRREQLREIRETDEGRALFQSRFALLKNPWNLTREQKISFQFALQV